MGTKYSSVTISGYNAAPPPDDGSETASNKITWNSTIKSKLADPIKNQAASINTALVNALNLASRAVVANDSAGSSDHWRTLEVTGTTTITLSDAATMGAGYIVTVYNAGVGTVTIARQTGTDTIDGSAANTTVAAGKAKTFLVDAAVTGYITLSNTGAITPPAGSNTQVQYNNSGVFGASADLTYTSGTNTTTAHTLTVSTGKLTVTGGEITTGSTTAIQLETSGGTQVKVINIASAVNWVRLNGDSVGLPPQVGVDGSDTNIDLQVFSKGTGGIVFLSSAGSLTQFKVAAYSGDASAADIFTASGGTGNAYLTATGGTNINANITPKGTGSFFVWKSTPQSGQPLFKVIPQSGTPQNYVQIANQVTNNPPQIDGTGGDAAVGLLLTSKGNGANSYIEFAQNGTSTALVRMNTLSASNSRLDIGVVSNDIQLSVSLSGGLTNQNLILKPAGTGSVVFNPGSGTTLGLDSSSATTVNLYATPTTVSVGAAATTMNLGAATGATNVKNTLTTAASTTGRAGCNIPSGTAPTSPVSGDFWYDGTNLKFRDGVTTRTITWT